MFLERQDFGKAVNFPLLGSKSSRVLHFPSLDWQSWLVALWYYITTDDLRGKYRHPVKFNIG